MNRTLSFAMEVDLFRPASEWIAEAEGREEGRYVAIHGPDDAPERPPWPVHWCEECHDWSPTDSVHGHRSDTFVFEQPFGAP